MSTPRSWPGKQQFPAISGRFMVDTYRGRMRVRAWPKRRGKPKSQAQQIAIDRFREANRLAKQAPGEIQNWAIDVTRGSGIYPRDLLVRMILAGLFNIQTEDGLIIRHGRPRLETKVFQGFSLALDTPYNMLSTGGTVIPWPLPIIDTAGFWNPGSPDVITIPEGVTLMSFRAGMKFTSSARTSINFLLSKLSPGESFLASDRDGSTTATTIESGVVIVQPGEQYRVRLDVGSIRTLDVVQTFFSGIVEAAEV